MTGRSHSGCRLRTAVATRVRVAEPLCDAIGANAAALDSVHRYRDADAVPQDRLARLRGRTRDLEHLDGLVADVVGGGSRVLLIRGEAGIGKTSLLDHVAAARHGAATVLRVTGVPSEQHLPLAGLLAVVRPLADHVADLPPVQASSLGAALGRTPGGAGDPFSLYAGTLGLLAAAAEAAPLLVLVDDLQWLDPTSGAALLFAARRLDREGIGMIFAFRDGEEVELDLRGLPELRLTGLDDDAARGMVADRAGIVPADEALAQLLRTAGGNPLALAELTGQLDDAQLTGQAPLPEPLVLGPRLGELYRRRLGALPDHTRGRDPPPRRTPDRGARQAARGAADLRAHQHAPNGPNGPAASWRAPANGPVGAPPTPAWNSPRRRCRSRSLSPTERPTARPLPRCS